MILTGNVSIIFFVKNIIIKIVRGLYLKGEKHEIFNQKT